MSTVDQSMQLFEQPGTTSDQINKTTYVELAVRTGKMAQRAALLTDEVDETSGQVHQLHAEALSQALAASALNLESEPLVPLLGELTDAFAYSWATLARCIRLTPTAVRKWRRGDEPSRENKQRVARLVAFSRFLKEIDPRVHDVGDWLEGLMTPAATLSRADLYRVGADVDLLRMARSVVRVGPDNIRPEDLLDHYVEGWRTRHANDERFSVEWDSEGAPSIVYREDGESRSGG
jgi:hypothetical protein